MVRLRGMPRPGPQGRGMGRPMLRHMRPEQILPPFGMPRGRLMRGHPVRPGPPRLPPPRMAPPPPPRLGLPPPLPPRRLPLPPHPPLHPRDLPPPMGRRPLPPPPMARRPRMPPMPPPPPIPPMPPGPPHLRRPIRPGPPFLRGRGGVMRRGVKRLGGVTNGRAKKAQKRKEKTEGEFFCESCDRGFKTQELLDTHIGEHQVCGRDGCTFAAHPKIVMKHVTLQHDSGLYNRIAFTQNPEDVAKWIAERKSRYPTKDNVERKEAQTSEMLQRGERIPDQTKPFNNKEKFDSWRDRRKRRNQNHTNCNGHKKQMRPSKPVSNTTSDETKWRDPEAWRGNLPKFPGTAAFPLIKEEPQIEKEEDKCFSDDDSELNRVQVPEIVKKPLFSSVLASLMLNYGSDMTDDEDDDTISQVRGDNSAELRQGTSKKVEEKSVESNDKSELIKRKNEGDSDSGPEECGIQRVDNTNHPIPNPNKGDNKLQENKHVEPKTSETIQNSRPKPPVRPPLKKYQLSLLEKLLQNEIRHERNAILQCVRYVVNNNFFGCGKITN